MNYRTDADFAAEMDRADPLGHFREKFHIPPHAGGESIYLCGNSLGLLPKTTERYLQEELESWRHLAVKAHSGGHRPWMPYHESLTAGTARVVGALPAEVINMNALTVNLHLMMVSFYRPTPSRHRILIERGAFPSDRYAVASQIRFHGFDPATSLVELAPSDGRTTLDMDDVEAAIHTEGERLALVLLPGVQYYSGQAFDIARVTRAAHAVGAGAGFDLAHAAGNLLLRLHDWETDFAVWCTYKYLNAGPGSVGGCFVHARHLSQTDIPRFAGWWGHDKTTRFKMRPEFSPMPTAEAWQLSNPPILAMAPLLASLEIFESAGMGRLREKSVQLTGYLEFLLNEQLADGVKILTPRNPGERGCQLSLRLQTPVQRARNIFTCIEEHGIVADWREPDVIRVAPVPLYNSYAEVHRFVEILREVLGTE